MVPRMKRSASRLLALVALLLVATAVLVRPLAPRGLGSHARPAASYAEAVAIVDSLRALDSPAIASECRTACWTHGARAGRAVVLLHGLTNCPAQFDSLARLVFATGANVLVPRLPRHGFADHMTDELARLEARELSALTDRSLDAARGLGDTVIVAGLSTGGVMSAWAAAVRPDVDRAVVIAPMLAWAGAPGPLRTAAITRLGLLLPNQFVWWDDKARQALAGPRHVYPRFASRAVAATLWLGGAVLAHAASGAPAARSLVLVTVGGDHAADNGTAATLARLWRAHGARELLTYEFPETLHLSHDIVDPAQVGANPALTYPVLLRYILR